MADRSSKKRPRRVNALAAHIVAEATGEKADDGKDPRVVALCRTGGKARAEEVVARALERDRQERTSGQMGKAG